MHIGLLDWLFGPSSKSTPKTLCMSISSLPPTHNQFPTHFSWLWDKILEENSRPDECYFRRLVSKTVLWLSDEIRCFSPPYVHSNINVKLISVNIAPFLSLDPPAWIGFLTAFSQNLCHALVNHNQVPVHYIQWIKTYCWYERCLFNMV